MRRRREAEVRDRQAQQGLGKAIQFYKVQDGTALVIGRELMIGRWLTFTDFLLDYLAERMGRLWIAEEMSKGVDGHLIGQWASAMRGAKSSVPPGMVTSNKINNGFRSILSLAYNIYLIEHHYEQYDKPLFDRFVKRLRRPDGFLATVAETYSAAAFLKAGFMLEYEDDLQAGHHAEFVATYPLTGRRFSVEVKSRTGALRPGAPIKDQIKLKNKLSQALKKDLPWSRVVFVDLNIPNVIVDHEDPLLADALSEVEEAERSLRIKNAPAPSAYLFLANQPFHYNLTSLEGAPMIGALGFKLPTFQPRGAISFRDHIIAREAHPEMHALIQSMAVHSEPPSTFDGQAPEFVYEKPKFPRWLIGNEYVVPGPNNAEVVAVLTSACAMPDQRKMMGIFALNGFHFSVEAPMTEYEVTVYLRKPETFFGVVQEVTQQVKSAAELADFFYSVYKDTPRETLLDWMKDHPLIDQVRDFSQKDLAIWVCEQWGLGANQHQKRD
ncbi:hypothetical protein [Bradyrhizobium sp. LVM 105]|uniref:hypothetical protein n=1 Tax=Bradyrhizobium sp. LVM 105 TaxID=2341115 RepID=UPI001FDEC0F6|nr:hypothetical protein [Bradyrhizobium sp. LVM 105]